MAQCQTLDYEHLSHARAFNSRMPSSFLPFWESDLRGEYTVPAIEVDLEGELIVLL